MNDITNYLYMSYGSNMGGNEMKGRCPNSKKFATGLLKDWSLSFKGSFNGYLTIDKKEGSEIPVALWQISSDDLPSLDAYEGYGTLYDRKVIDVIVDGVPFKCFTYLMFDTFDYALPTDYYYMLCCDLYYENGYGDRTHLLDEALTTARNKVYERQLKRFF